MRRRFVFATCAVVLGGYLLPGCHQRADRPGIEKTEALLRGDPAVRLASIEIHYQQRRVYCSDPDVLRYLEGCFREGDQLRSPDGGVTYLLRLRFEGGGSLEAATYWLACGFRLYMPYQETDVGDEPRGSVIFRLPVPAAAKTMIDFLNDHSERTRGKVLHLEAGASRLERDDSLRAK